MKKIDALKKIHLGFCFKQMFPKTVIWSSSPCFPKPASYTWAALDGIPGTLEHALWPARSLCLHTQVMPTSPSHLQAFHLPLQPHITSQRGFSYFVYLFGTGVWTQGLHLKTLH
jgi:hypothetical protein